MECYCEPACDTGEYSTVWNVTWQKARKRHFCCECHEPIMPGQKYERIFSIFEGDIMTYKTCAFCANEYQRLLAKHKDSDVVWHKGEDDLACLLVWDIRNETDHATGK